MSILSRPYFHDEDAAFAFLESVIWTDGPVCGKCGCPGRITKVKANAKKRIRVGLYRCGDCKSQFRVTVGTVFEHIRLPLHKCLQAAHLMCSSKKGISAHQISRILEVQYKTAWFLCHRIREAMRDDHLGFLGGSGMAVEADETYIGGKAKNRATRKPAAKKAVLSLVERDGKVRSFHLANVTAESVRPLIVKNADKASMLMTDESVIYPKVGKEFAAHGAVNHSASEYARLGGYVHINASENFFSVVKRGIVGTYHSVSEAHLHRYLAEFDFRYNNRSGLGCEDGERAHRAVKGIVGKRLTYRRLDA
ncbi:MAG: IS1595 family transposase [Beijerinckiaceae bacterium]|nr:IS1595 family transposase [Beijerinckiaceae bacterium]